MIPAVDAQKRVAQTLVGFPQRVVDAYLRYAESGKPEFLDAVVLGVLYFQLARKPATALEAMPGTTRLVDDLGCDSLSMLDTVFTVESLFDFKLEDGELAKVGTLDDLRQYLRRQAIAQSTATD